MNKQKDGQLDRDIERYVCSQKDSWINRDTEKKSDKRIVKNDQVTVINEQKLSEDEKQCCTCDRPKERRKEDVSEGGREKLG